MKRELTAQVGADGVLTLQVSLGREEANTTVRVVVETGEKATSGPPSRFASREEWLTFVNETGGKWQGEFERPPQGEYEERDPL